MVVPEPVTPAVFGEPPDVVAMRSYLTPVYSRWFCVLPVAAADEVTLLLSVPHAGLVIVLSRLPDTVMVKKPAQVIVVGSPVPSTPGFPPIVTR